MISDKTKRIVGILLFVGMVLWIVSSMMKEIVDVEYEQYGCGSFGVVTPTNNPNTFDCCYFVEEGGVVTMNSA